MPQSKRNKLPFYCECCKSTKNLLVHHKDHNRNNNNIENLQILCTSCHAVVHTRIKNINKMRWYYITHKDQMIFKFE